MLSIFITASLPLPKTSRILIHHFLSTPANKLSNKQRDFLSGGNYHSVYWQTAYVQSCSSTATEQQLHVYYYHINILKVIKPLV